MAQRVPTEVREDLAKILSDKGISDESAAAAARLAADLLGGGAAPAALATPAEDRPEFMDVDAYATHIDVSPWKVRQLVALGLPHSRLPGGRKLIRVHVAEADLWVKAQGGKI